MNLNLSITLQIRTGKCELDWLSYNLETNRLNPPTYGASIKQIEDPDTWEESGDRMSINTESISGTI